MKLSYSEIKSFDDRLTRAVTLMEHVSQQNSTILSNQRIIMSGIADLKQNMQDLRGLAAQYLALIRAKDEANAALQVRIAELVAAANISDAEKAALQAAIDEAVTESQATEDEMRAGIPGVPPVGTEPLALTFADRAAFDAGVEGYTGPESVTLDGTEVKAGTSPALDYFTHSATGEINTTGPTD